MDFAVLVIEIVFKEKEVNLILCTLSMLCLPDMFCWNEASFSYVFMDYFDIIVLASPVLFSFSHPLISCFLVRVIV